MSLPGRLIDVGGLRLFHHRAGKRGGPPLVFVHGYMVGHYSLRRILVRFADAGHDVLALDLPGCGESDRPSPREFAYDGDAYLSTLLGFLDAVGVERPVLIGHSMGGALALLAAARHPERFERIVVIDPLVFAYPVPLEARLLLTPVVGLPLYKTLFTRGLLQITLRRQIFKDPSHATDEWVDYLWERLQRPGGMEATHAALRFVSDPSPIEQCLPRVRAHTRIVWGEDDRLFPSAWASRLAQKLARADFHIVRDCGHSPPEERPDEVLAAVLPFLSEAERVESARGS